MLFYGSTEQGMHGVILTFPPLQPPFLKMQSAWGRQYWHKSKLLRFHQYSNFSWKLGHYLFILLSSTFHCWYSHCINLSLVCPFPSVGVFSYRYFVLFSLAFNIWHSHLICEKTILHGSCWLISWCLTLNFTSSLVKVITSHLFSFLLYCNFL
jgi:hypothetical protein